MGTPPLGSFFLNFDENADDILRAISDRYLDIHCSVMTTNEGRIENTKEMINRTHLNIIYSGGITSLNDLEYLMSCGADGAMIGTSLYTNKIRLDEAVMLCKRGEKGE